jgi:hypothetical protein
MYRPKTLAAAVVAIATLGTAIASPTMAAYRHHWAEPGYAAPYRYGYAPFNRAAPCMIDEGYGRLAPCDSGGGGG